MIPPIQVGCFVMRNYLICDVLIRANRLFFESPSHPCRPPGSGRVTAFGPGRKYNLLPTLAKNVPPAHFLRVVPIDKGALRTCGDFL